MKFFTVKQNVKPQIIYYLLTDDPKIQGSSPFTTSTVVIQLP